MTFRKFSNWLEAVAAVAIVVFVVLLFVHKPITPAPAPPDAVAAAGGLDGSKLFGRNCAGCHGGDGSGGIGPRLAGRVVTRFPDPATQIAVVTDGRRGMPSFGGSLSAEEIAAIVEYTRTILGT
jgi:cytochrome c oxidase subunit II